MCLYVCMNVYINYTPVHIHTHGDMCAHKIHAYIQMYIWIVTCPEHMPSARTHIEECAYFVFFR
eukprot:c41357_g1_i1 orf=3-191(-)